ncbi:MAG: hypothetical protein ACKVJE_16705 [Pseudomonadales bacterium]|jgi:hypothetical protein
MKKLMTIAAFTFASATAIAQPAGGTDLFILLDIDADQMISVEEAKIHEPVLAQFETLDLNKDGQLSVDEFNLLAKG